jgi:hypothetical protein
MTPGQRAYEAYRHSPGPTMMPLTARGFEWESLQSDDQAAWEAAVRAAKEGAPPVTPLDTALEHVREARQFLAEGNRYRAALEKLADAVDHYFTAGDEAIGEREDAMLNELHATRKALEATP